MLEEEKLTERSIYCDGALVPIAAVIWNGTGQKELWGICRPAKWVNPERMRVFFAIALAESPSRAASPPCSALVINGDVPGECDWRNLRLRWQWKANSSWHFVSGDNILEEFLTLIKKICRDTVVEIYWLLHKIKKLNARLEAGLYFNHRLIARWIYCDENIMSWLKKGKRPLHSLKIASFPAYFIPGLGKTCLFAGFYKFFFKSCQSKNLCEPCFMR
jgi:hypothetical protein